MDAHRHSVRAAWRVRDAVPGDNEGLLELARRCPIPGPVHVAFDRSPDFFAWLRVQGDGVRVALAESESGEILGSAGVTERRALWGGREVTVVRGGDLRVLPAYRHTRILPRLLGLYRQTLIEGRCHHGYGEIIEGHGSSIRSQAILGDRIRVHADGAAAMHLLLPLWAFVPGGRWILRPAGPGDLPGLAALLAGTYGGDLGAPVFSAGFLADATRRHASFGVHDFWVAEEPGGELAACVGVWDQSPLRRFVPCHIGAALRVFCRAMVLPARVLGLGPVPAQGVPFRFVHLRWPACRSDTTQALRALLRCVMNQVRRNRVHTGASIGFHEGSRLSSALAGIPRVRFRVLLYSHWVRGAGPEPPRQGVAHYVDTALF